jgi:hypothetical protein
VASSCSGTGEKLEIISGEKLAREIPTTAPEKLFRNSFALFEGDFSERII